jgi:HK97 family phage prohead protease
MEQKQLNLSFKAEGDEGVISGYGSVFNELDNHGDRVMPGAFAKSLKSRMPKMLWQHHMWEPLGRWTEAVEDGKGLRLRGKLTTTTTRGRDAYELIKDGALDGLSIGYRVPPGGGERDGDERHLKQIDLYEVSLVTMGSNAKALITDVKASEMTVRDFDRALQNMGFDRTAAKTIIATGFKGYQDSLRDAGVLGPEVDQRDADELKQSLETLLQGIGGHND